MRTDWKRITPANPNAAKQLGNLYNEKRLPVKKASISIGRLLNYHWHSLLEVDPMLRAALLPICDCTPRRLQQCMTLMLKRYPDPRGTMRWAMHLLGQLAPVLDWEVVLAYGRFADPAVAEHALTQS